MATFTKSQRRVIAAFMAEHHDWDIRYDRLAAEDLDPGARPSQALFVNLPDHFAATNGWTLYPADGSRVAIVFGDNDPVVKDLAEALSDIGNLRVYPSTEADTEEAERVCPVFMPAMVSPPSPPPSDFQHAA